MAYDQQLADALKEIETLKAERDLWKARAFAMFWRLPDKTIIGELREDVEKAKSYVKLAPDATIL